MPELPEVETVCRMLADRVLGSRITAVDVIRRDLRWQLQADFEERCLDACIEKVFRRGKYIIIQLNKGFIIWHLGMSGSIKIQNDFLLQKHDHVLLELSCANYLIYNDPRRFGSLYWTMDYANHARIKNLGLEPLLPTTTPELLFSITSTRAKNIKDTIMDAANIVGVGNIYANEALFLTGIHPSSQAKSLSLKKITDLLANIRLVLNRAIASGGTTLNDYVNLEGKPGYFQQELHVYGRSGQQCLICSNILKKLEDFSRQTVYCDRCQS